MIEYHKARESEQDVADLQGASGPVDLFLSLQPPAEHQVIDLEYLNAVWSALCTQVDVSIKTEASSKSATSLSVASKLSDPAHLQFINAHAHSRLITNEERQWLAIAGHPIDRRKIPGLEWKCLAVIAEAGPSGILQPEIRAITGQDKRSVPKRTDGLASKGYVVKEQCLGNHTMTSLCRLKRFVEDNIAPSKEQEHDVKYYDTWWNATLQLLRDNGGLVAMDDLRKHLVRPVIPTVGYQAADAERASKKGLLKLDDTSALCVALSLQAWLSALKLKTRPKNRARPIVSSYSVTRRPQTITSSPLTCSVCAGKQPIT